MKMFPRLIAVIVGTIAAAAPMAPAAPAWEQILTSPPMGTIPAGQREVLWSGDLARPLLAAQVDNRPLLVVVRCGQKAGAGDKAILEGNDALDALLRQFVTVRLDNAKAIDLRLLPMADFQDLDTLFWIWMLSPQGHVYAVFGGRDENDTRVSQAALIATLKRVVPYHYDPRRVQWKIDGPAARTLGKPQTPADLPGYASWSARPAAQEGDFARCMRCHQVSQVLRQPEIDAGKFDKQKGLEIWPLPENVGLTLDRDDGLLVKSVKAGSPADKAGLKAGDLLGAAGERRLFAEADFRGVLHRGPRGAGTIDVVVVHEGKVRAAKLDLLDGWRKTSVQWRASLADGNIGAAPAFGQAAITAFDRRVLGLPADAMAFKPVFGKDMEKNPAYVAGLRPTHVVLAVDDLKGDLMGRPFRAWFHLKYNPGDKVTLTVRDGGLTRKIVYNAQ